MVVWEVEYTDEFEEWWTRLEELEQEKLVAAVDKLQEFGPALPRPLADTLAGSRHLNMKSCVP